MKKTLLSSLLLSSILLVACNDDTSDEPKPRFIPKEETQQKDSTPSEQSTNIEKEPTENATTTDDSKTEDVPSPTVEPTEKVSPEELASKKEYFSRKINALHTELNAMPEKVDSDLGVTNAMKNFYGISYERFDELLTELTDYIKTTLSTEEQVEFDKSILAWRQERAEKADLEIKAYEGGTFAHVAFYVTLYEETVNKVELLISEYL